MSIETRSSQAQVPPRTIEEHRDFLCEMVKLSLWFVHRWLLDHPEEAIEQTLRTRVDIFRKTDWNVGPSKNTIEAGDFTLPVWLELEAKLADLHQKLSDQPPQAFEAEAWPLLEDAVLARVERDFAEGDALDDFQCGSLRYGKGAKGDPPRVFFHIGNRVTPQSFFADPTYLPRCFMQLMDETQAKFGAQLISTSSWLNSYPRWLALFPQEWQDHLGPADTNVGWSQGHWGQFVSGRGTFNRRHGQMMRETGRLPFPPRNSWCTIAAMREHLRSWLD